MSSAQNRGNLPETTFSPALLETVRAARHIVGLTGAGVSAESGIPTFRQAQTGFWAKYDPQQLATPAAFRRNPRLVWRWYQWRRELVSGANANPAHYALAAMEQNVNRFTLVTQNVDGLHRQAGSHNIIELHGNLIRNKCFENGHPVAAGAEIASDDPEDPPRCPQCGGLLRPDVVWFGEALPASAIESAFSAARDADVFFAVGTSAVVHPAASLPLVALENGALTVEVNTEETTLSPLVDYAFRQPAGELLPDLLLALWPGATISGV